MLSLTKLMIRFRWAVVIVWLGVVLLSASVVPQLSGLLTNRFVLPGTETEKTVDLLEKHFGQKPIGSFILVVKGEPGSAKELVTPARAAAQRAAQSVEGGRLEFVAPVSDSIVSATIVTGLEPADAKNEVVGMREAAGQIPGAEVLLTGQSAIEHDLEPVFAQDLKTGELFIAIPIAIAILIFVFGSLSFLIPFLFAGATIMPTLGIIWILAHYMNLSTYLQNLVMLIGLGVAIDYSLLVVYRYREELEKGDSKEEAIVRTMQTAGRAVVFSGTAVAIGLSLMLFMPLPFMRGFGIGGLIIPLMSILCAVTLLPAMLYFMGAKLDRVRLIPKAVIAHRGGDRNFWIWLSQLIMRRPLRFAVITTLLLLTLAAPILAIKVTPGSNAGIPQTSESVRGQNILASAIGEGALAPTAILVDSGRAGGASTPEIQGAIERLKTELAADPEVERNGIRFENTPLYIDSTRRFLKVDAVGKHEFGAQESQDFARRLRADIVPAAAFPPTAKVFTGGGPSMGIDLIDLAYGAFPWLILAVLILTYFLLLRAFRSLLLPLKAIILNLLSIAAAYGLMVVFFKWGAGEPLGIIQFEQIEAWIPIFVFAMVFGLSMDYEVFLVSRMREEWDAGRTNEEAVSFGLAKTGRLVTAAGLVMFAAFMGFVAGSIVGLQQFGFGLGVAILIDVTIVRALLVPSAMKLFGQWNWWLPTRVASVFRVQPSPLRPEQETP